MEAPADRQTFHVWWELSCSGGTGGEENLLGQIRAFQAQTPQDLGEQIITTSTLGRTKEKGNQQVLQGHTCSINLIKSSPCRVALTACTPSSSASLAAFWSSAAAQRKQNVHNLTLQIHPWFFLETSLILHQNQIRVFWLNNLCQLFAFRVYYNA